MSESTAVDPVCHMKVDPKKAAATRIHAGKTYYFCSTGCAKAFEGDPKRYVSAGAQAS
jgi:Cu+-exporting ATPase